MTMKEMDLYLEARGFEVSRGYDRRGCMYTFTISKGGIVATADFKYPDGCDDVTKDNKQRVFLEYITSVHARYTPALKPEEPWDKSGIKNVIFNPPATIVFWNDGTKTVVQARGDDEFDPEKGLAMAIVKKTLGNKYDYYNTFVKWTKKYYKEEEKAQTMLADFLEHLRESPLRRTRLEEDKLFGENDPKPNDSDWQE